MYLSERSINPFVGKCSVSVGSGPCCALDETALTKAFKPSASLVRSLPCISSTRFPINTSASSPDIAECSFGPACAISGARKYVYSPYAPLGSFIRKSSTYKVSSSPRAYHARSPERNPYSRAAATDRFAGTVVSSLITGKPLPSNGLRLVTVHPANEFGRMPCADAGMAARSTNRISKGMAWRIVSLLLDATILLRVPVGSYCGSPAARRAVVGDQFGLIVGEAIEAVEIGDDAAIQAVGDALPLVGLLQQLFIARVADKRDLRKHRRHIRANQHHKRSLLHAAIALVLTHQLQPVR